MQPYQKKSSLAIAIFCLAWAITFLLLDVNIDLYYYSDLTPEHRRTLRLSPHTAASANDNDNDYYEDVESAKTTITIYLTEESDNPAYSIFKTDLLQRYSSGRFNFVVHQWAHRHLHCENDDPSADHHVLRFNKDEPLPGPCLAVSRNPIGGGEASNLKCNYPNCKKTMVTNDEICRYRTNDIRQYYTHPMKEHYLPLGPRFDSWGSLQRITQDKTFSFKSSSHRKYSFNAIFSQSTNTGRTNLASVLEDNDTVLKLISYVSIAKDWKQYANDPRNELIQTTEYTKVLCDSVFTLVPAGHNAETYRMYEAIEAGSIPVVVRQDLHGGRANCKGSLHHWVDAPLLVLDSWDDLYPTIEMIMRDVTKLNDMQVKLRIWYDEYMRKVVGDFEDFMIMESNTGAVAGEIIENDTNENDETRSTTDHGLFLSAISSLWK